MTAPQPLLHGAACDARHFPCADGRWQPVRLAPGLAVADVPVAEDEPACIVVQGGRMVWVGPQECVPAQYAALALQGGGGMLATPGLVDCHTHLVYGGSRVQAFVQRASGSAAAPAAQASDGGIRGTVQATRDASEDALLAQALPRLQHLLQEGVTAIEIKSGYGLSFAHERKQLRVARRLGGLCGVTVRTTFLGAHTLPPEYEGRSQAYIDLVCSEILPALAAEELVDAVDVCGDPAFFTLAHMEQMFQAAKAHGLPVKLHAEQLEHLEDSAALAADYGALSCAHLERLSARGIAAMQRAASVAVLLPSASYTLLLREVARAPIAQLRAAHIPMAVATDHNPGTSPNLSLLLAANMACTLLGLTVPEALAGITRHAAAALGLDNEQGLIAAGRAANFVLWPVQQAPELVYWLGLRSRATIVRQGRIAQQA